MLHRSLWDFPVRESHQPHAARNDWREDGADLSSGAAAVRDIAAHARAAAHTGSGLHHRSWRRDPRSRRPAYPDRFRPYCVQSSNPTRRVQSSCARSRGSSQFKFRIFRFAKIRSSLSGARRRKTAPTCVTGRAPGEVEGRRPQFLRVDIECGSAENCGGRLSTPPALDRKRNRQAGWRGLRSGRTV